MATKTATRAPARTPAKPAPREALPPRSATTPTKAQQAARAQGRAEPPPRRHTSDDIERDYVINQNKREQAQRAPTPARQPARPAPSREVAEYGQTAALPAFMRNDAGAGKENIGRDDLETPRLKLIQGLSPELESYNDLHQGDFFHSAAEAILGESFVGVPIYMERQYILWRPRDSGGGIIARAPDGIHWSPAEGDVEVQLDKKDGGGRVSWRLAPTVAQSGLANWGTMNPDDPNSPPAATLMYNYVLSFPEHPDLMPAVLTFQRSTIRHARRFNTKLKTTRTPLFGLQFRFTSIDETNGAGQKFKSIQVTGAGVVEDERLYHAYKELHEGFKAAGLSIKDIEGLQADVPGDNVGEDEQTDSRGNAVKY